MRILSKRSFLLLVTGDAGEQVYIDEVGGGTEGNSGWQQNR
jgi:hypothetical protein